jgi:hypothetical protein
MTAVTANVRGNDERVNDSHPPSASVSICRPLPKDLTEGFTDSEFDVWSSTCSSSRRLAFTASDRESRAQSE